MVKKGATKLMAVTCQISTDFQNSFTTGKGRKFPTKSMYYFPPHLNVCCRTTFGNLKVQIWSKSGRKCKQKMSHEPVKFS